MLLIDIDNDFNAGPYAIAHDSNDIEWTTGMQDYIDRFEEFYVRKLMGKTQGNEFIADKSNPTQDPLFAFLEDAFTEQPNNSTMHVSLGMHKLLVCFIFYHWIIENQSGHTQAGVGGPNVETTTLYTEENAHRYAERQFNAMLGTWEAIQWYCRTNNDDYPDFAGQDQNPKYSSIL